MKTDIKPKLFDYASEILQCTCMTDELLQITLVNEALQARERLQSGGLLVRAKARDLGAWCRKTSDAEDPVWLIALSEDVSGDLEELARDSVSVLNRLSDDMLYSLTFLEWSGANVRITVPSRCLIVDTYVSREAGILLLLITPQRAVLARAVMGDGFDGCLQGAHASSGINYKPYRIWSDEELADAAAYAKEKGTDGPYVSGEKGLIWLYPFDYHAEEKAYPTLSSLRELLQPANAASCSD